MNKHLLRSIAPQGMALVVLMLHCSASLAQPGVGTATPPAAGGGTKTNATSIKRVSDWFSKYDQIRRAAQMSPEEKAKAHKLMTAALTGNPADKAAAKNMLSSMSSRYQRAISSLRSLSTVPETSKLHSGYLRYFQTGNDFFQQYQRLIAKNINPTAIQGLDSSRKQLGLLDVSNKLLDKKLRKQYNIPPFRA